MDCSIEGLDSERKVMPGEERYGCRSLVHRPRERCIIIVVLVKWLLERLKFVAFWIREHYVEQLELKKSMADKATGIGRNFSWDGRSSAPSA